MIRVHSLSGSPFARRVQLALEEKGIDYEVIYLDMSAGDLTRPEYLEMLAAVEAAPSPPSTPTIRTG